MTWTAIALFLTFGQPVAVMQAPGFTSQRACQAAIASDRARLEGIAAQVSEETGQRVTVRLACVRERGRAT